MAHRPVVLTILDGWGLRDAREANAVALAETPSFDGLMARCPHARLAASGEDVGLPPGQMGNSEVGHTNIGAGRIVWMDLPRIDRAIESGEFDENPALIALADRAKAAGGRVHLIGLASPGGVHAHQRHIAAAARRLEALGVPVLLHLFTDGRDTAPTSAPACFAELETALDGAGTVATVTGRFYAMDRDKRWERVEAAWKAIVLGEGERTAATAAEAVAAAHDAGETDEFVVPTIIGGYDGARDGDALLALNFRADRTREILSALAEPGFDAFDVSGRPDWSAMAGIVQYSEAHDRFMSAMFPDRVIPNTLGAWVAAKGLRQFRLAETEKYPHVTFFLNGGIETPAVGEERHMAPSPKVRTYDLAPEMSAGEVTETLVGAIGAGYDLIVVNYANPDMVGHTGDLDAAIAACEAVDRGLGAALDALKTAGGAMIVTADHGNAEMMTDPETGGPHTSHTLSPVPVILVEPGGRHVLADGRLADLAPTVLALMGLEAPEEMTGTSLLRAAPA